MLSLSKSAGAHVVVEQTSKKWKGMQVWGWLCGGIGLLMCATPDAGFGALLLLVGLVMVVWARSGAWWTNG